MGGCKRGKEWRPPCVRKRQKQAEFLVHEKVDWNVIRFIVTLNDEIQEKISHDIAMCTHKPEILVKKDWYYER